MSNAVVSAIEFEDLNAAGVFLCDNLNPEISPAQWQASVTHEWSTERPNFGMKLMDREKLVGVFLAIYSEQEIRGQRQRICNPHTWCVLPEYRARAVSLAAALVRQPGYHFSMLTPNPNVDAVFRFMKFKELDARLTIFPNLPAFSFVEVVDESAQIRARLSGGDLRDFELHTSIPWLHHLVVGDAATGYCWIVFKPRRWKRLPCADLIHVSNRAAFARHFTALRNYLLFRKKMVWGRVETRFIGDHPLLAYRTTRTQSKLFLSDRLHDSDVRDLYSELVSLDL